MTAKPSYDMKSVGVIFFYLKWGWIFGDSGSLLLSRNLINCNMEKCWYSYILLIFRKLISNEKILQQSHLGINL